MAILLIACPLRARMSIFHSHCQRHHACMISIKDWFIHATDLCCLAVQYYRVTTVSLTQPEIPTICKSRRSTDELKSLGKIRTTVEKELQNFCVHQGRWEDFIFSPNIFPLPKGAASVNTEQSINPVDSILLRSEDNRSQRPCLGTDGRGRPQETDDVQLVQQRTFGQDQGRGRTPPPDNT